MSTSPPGLPSGPSVPGSPPPAAEDGGAATAPVPSRRRRRILSILPYTPSTIRARSLQLLGAALACGEVHLLYLDDGGPLELPDGLAAVHRVPNASGLRRLFRVAGTVLRGGSTMYSFYDHGGLPRILRRLGPGSFDLVMAERLFIRREWLQGTPLFLDLMDSAAAKSRAMAGLETGLRRWLYRRDARVLPALEREICAQAALVVVTAERERQNVEALGAPTPVGVFHHVPWFPAAAEPPPPSRTLVFHGKLSYAPNREALRVLQDQVLPALGAGWELLVIGPAPPELRRLLPRLHFLGRVEDLQGTLRRGGLSVQPLAVAVGAQGKVMESLAAGVPVLTTPQAAAGVPEPDRVLGGPLQAADIPEFPERIRAWFERSEEERREQAARALDYARTVLEPLRTGTGERLRQLLHRHIWKETA